MDLKFDIHIKTNKHWCGLKLMQNNQVTRDQASNTGRPVVACDAVYARTRAGPRSHKSLAPGGTFQKPPIKANSYASQLVNTLVLQGKKAQDLLPIFHPAGMCIPCQESLIHFLVFVCGTQNIIPSPRGDDQLSVATGQDPEYTK